MTTATTHTPRFDILLRGSELQKSARTAEHDVPSALWRCLRVLSDWHEVKHQSKRDLFIVMWQSALFDNAELKRARESHTAGMKRFLLLPDESPAESLLERVFELKVRSAARIHTPKLQIDDLDTFIRRFLAALSLSLSEQTIADAWWEKDNLVVLSPTFKRLKVPIESIPTVQNASPRDLEEFKIDEHGEFIYWPSCDMHMGWPQFEQAVNPQARIRAQQRSKAFNKRYGLAVRSMRREVGLRQSDISGLNERTVRRIEQGQTRATASALAKLASAHSLDTNRYMSALAERLAKLIKP